MIVTSHDGWGRPAIDQLVDRTRARPQLQIRIRGDGQGLLALIDDKKEVFARNDIKGIDLISQAVDNG